MWFDANNIQPYIKSNIPAKAATSKSGNIVRFIAAIAPYPLIGWRPEITQKIIIPNQNALTYELLRLPELSRGPPSEIP